MFFGSRLIAVTRTIASADKLRQKPRCTVTMDPQLLAKLDLAKGPVPRSEMVEAAVRFGLELFEDMKSMAERYAQAAKARERRGPK